ncbi:MAG TPA: YciI family protein [Streptosporangiaceae bacterium]|nr:YciI family protein [Streptosporangiaceae bacterium]
MKYALLIYAKPGANESAPPAPDGVIDSWVDYTAALKDTGSLLGAEQLQPTDTATSVTVRGSERLLTDGPFVETKEHLLGFYLLDVNDLDAALDWAAQMPIMRYGAVEVRPVVEGAPWRKVLD